MNRLSENHKHILRIFAKASIVLVAGCIGYRLGLSARLGGSGAESLWGQSERHKNAMNECQNYAEEFDRGRSLASYDGRDAEYFAVLEKDHLEEKGRRMSALFRRSEIGFALVQATTLVDYGPDQNSAEGRIVAEAIKLLESDPQETFGEIRDAIGQIGTDLTAERQVLIQLVARLDLEVSAKVNFFSEQLYKVSAIQDLKQNKLNSSVILLTMMQLGADPSQVETALRQVLAGQSNYNIRSFLISIYESKYPEEGKRIRNELGMFEM